MLQRGTSESHAQESDEPQSSITWSGVAWTTLIYIIHPAVFGGDGRPFRRLVVILALLAAIALLIAYLLA